MSLLDQLLEPWEEYLARRKLERMDAVVIDLSKLKATGWYGAVTNGEVIPFEVRHDR